MRRTVISDAAGVLVCGVALAQCEPNSERPIRQETLFAQGLTCALIMGALTLIVRAFPTPADAYLQLAQVFLVFGGFFSVGYIAGARLRRASRLRGIELAVFCALLAAFVHQPGAETAEPPEWGIATLLVVGFGFVSFAVRSLRRFGTSGEPFLNAVERRTVGAAVGIWYGLEPAVAADATRGISAYLGSSDLLTRAGLKAAIFGFRWTPLLTVGRPLPLTSLPAELQERHLLAIERGTFMPLRFGLLALRLVAGMMHYESVGPTVSRNPACPVPA